MNALRFAVIGGDGRNIALARLLAEDRHTVGLFGFSSYTKERLNLCGNLYEAVQDADYIIGPTPLTHNCHILNAAFNDEEIDIDNLFRLMKPNQIFFAGYIKKEAAQLAEKYNVRIVDILKREELIILNAIPTAEGAIKIAIEETDITLHGNNLMVIGYGRVGKILAGMLKGIGGHVSVVVNTNEAAAQALSAGLNVIHFNRFNSRLGEMDIIFNTVPEILINKSNIKHIDKRALIVDLASPPYGVDYDASREAGVKVLYTNSLPGKIAPVTTARYIKECIYNILTEMGRKDGI